MTNGEAFQLGSKVFHRAATDPQFHALALRDGTAAVEEVLGRPLPDGLKIRFVDNDGATFTLGLPPVRSGDELSDRELEAVAGGRGSSGSTGGRGGVIPVTSQGISVSGPESNITGVTTSNERISW